MSYNIRVVAKHQLTKELDTLKLIKLSHRNQLTWGVIKFFILKEMGNFKNKKYNFDIDGRLLTLNTFSLERFKIEKTALDVTKSVPNNSVIVYNRVPLFYNEKTHFIPHIAIEYTRDIDESKIDIQYY